MKSLRERSRTNNGGFRYNLWFTQGVWKHEEIDEVARAKLVLSGLCSDESADEGTVLRAIQLAAEALSNVYWDDQGEPAYWDGRRYVPRTEVSR